MTLAAITTSKLAIAGLVELLDLSLRASFAGGFRWSVAWVLGFVGWVRFRLDWRGDFALAVNNAAKVLKRNNFPMRKLIPPPEAPELVDIRYFICPFSIFASKEVLWETWLICRSALACVNALRLG